MTNYKLSGGEKGESLVVVYADGEPASIPGTHPNFDKILDLLRSGKSDDEAIQTLVNTLHVAGQKLSQLTDRVSVAPYGVFFDGDPLRTELADVLTELLQEDNEASLVSVAKFLENAAANQTMEGIDAMYRWITNGDLALTEDGMFLGYKGVRFTDDDGIESITSGTAMVDGVVHTGKIPNPVGSVITMPRSEVTSETSVACGPGLHAGTYDYANSFGYGSLILVEINPRDVVSVPSDHSCAKLRVSRYKVLKKIDDRFNQRLYREEEEAPATDGDFTETGEVDEQDTPSLKDVLEADPVFAGSDDETEDSKYVDFNTLTVTNTDGVVSAELSVDGSIQAEKLDIDGHESKESKLKKFADWFKGN